MNEARIERDLRNPPMVEPPPGLRGRILAGLDEGARRSRRGPAVLAAACVAMAGAAAIIGARGPLETRSPLPAPPAPNPGPAAALDPGPALLPAARYFAASLDRPMVAEAQSVLEDTRRAADFVVSCLPFTRGG